MLSLVITWMGDHQQMGKPSWYVTSHPRQLSLANPLWIHGMSVGRSWGVNRHATWCTWSCSVNWCLAEGWENGDNPRLMALEGLYAYVDVIIRPVYICCLLQACSLLKISVSLNCSSSGDAMSFWSYDFSSLCWMLYIGIWSMCASWEADRVTSR